MSQIDGFRPSKLYHLEPIGIGTADVESLTSYIKRVAHAHNTSTGMLLEKVILPELNKSYLNMRYLNSGRLKVCGYSGITTGLVDMIEKKTLNKELKYLTLIPWEDYISVFKLNKTWNSWCPICYEEMKQSGQVIFDKLIWNIEGIEVCEKHKVKLEQICPYCGKGNQLISNRSRVGYCDRCHAWLGLSSASTLIDDGLHNQIYDSVGRLLSERMKNTEAKSQFTCNIKKVLSLFSCRTNFCSAFNISQIACEGWLRGNKPSLYHAITLSLMLGIPLTQMLTAEIDLTNINNQIKNADIKHIKQFKEKFKTSNSINKEKIKHSLNLLMHSYDGTSLSRFCKENNISSITLKEHFPKEAEKILQLYRIHKEGIS